MSLSSRAIPVQGPIRVLVIQLARLGDTLQSLMALRAAKQLYPELEIHFVARERFASAARRVPWIKSVVTLPTDVMLGPVLTGDKTQAQALGDVARWLAPLCQQPWDFVINWSYSEASSYLTGLLPARVKLGYSRRRDRSFSSTDGWSNYIQAIVQGNHWQNIHLTDILTTQILTALQIHVGEPANEGNSPVTSKSFFSLELGERDECIPGDGSRKWVGIQLGAAREDKTWPVESWVRFATRVLTRNTDYNVVLLGGKDDLPRARQFLQEISHQDVEVDSKRIVSLVGETDFDLWASVVSRCQWLASGDTAAIHLASVLGTRVLNISVGPVRWTETGPYGNGHYVVAAKNPCPACEKPTAGAAHACHEAVTAEAAYAAWSYAIGEWTHRRQFPLSEHFDHLELAEHAAKVKILRSRIRNTSEGGGVAYEPLLQHPFEYSDWSGMAMGHIARAWYCGWVPPIGQELSRSMITPQLIKQLRDLEESSLVLSKVCEEARKTAATLNLKSGALRSDKIMRLRDRDELRDLGKKLIELDTLMERVGKTQLPLRAFSQMSKVLMHNLRGDRLSELGRESADSYKQLGEGVAILREWIGFTLDLARPKAIKTGASAPLQLL